MPETVDWSEFDTCLKLALFFAGVDPFVDDGYNTLTFVCRFCGGSEGSLTHRETCHWTENQYRLKSLMARMFTP